MSGPWRVRALGLAVVVLLTADTAVLIAATDPAHRPTRVDVLGRVLERPAAPPWLAARRAPAPRRWSTPTGDEPPAVFASGAASAAPPASASAVPSWVRRQGELALARISYPWRTLGFTIDFRSGRAGLRAITYTRERRIVVHVRRGEPVARTAFDLAHELGHAFDLVHGTWPRRQRWFELRGIDPSTPWFGCSGCDDLGTGAGDLAEVFALWQVGLVDFASRLAPSPGPAELADLVQLLDPTWTSGDDPTREDDEAAGEDGQAPEGGDDGATGDDRGGDPDPEDEDADDDGGPGEDDGGGAGDDGPLPCPLVCT